MTQQQLAIKLGVSPQFISKWIHGKSGLKPSTAVRWATILNIDFATLMLAKRDIKTRSIMLGINQKKGV